MDRHTFDSLAPKLREGVAKPGRRPGLLYDAEDLARLRRRAASCHRLVAQAVEQAERTLSSPDFLHVTEPYYSLGKLSALTAAQMLQPAERFASGILRLLRRFVQAERWVAHVHGAMKCDHATANAAAASVLALEAIGDGLSPQDEQELSRGIYERSLRPFLQACEARSEFWAKREHQFNWRIMTCGEAGLAALGLGDIPDRDRILEFALEGVADILDRVPAEGDWEEGPGYWAGTLLLGLRFALALRRATDGRVNLFQHKGLQPTADFFVHVTLPDGSVFNYGDNSPHLGPTCLHLLARELRSSALAWTARKMGHGTVWDFLFDDPDLPGACPTDAPRAKVFPTTGIAVARSDWSADAVFLGFKSGPVNVGHSHLDVNSFVLSKGSTPLLIDPGIWPYCHFRGFFDVRGPRWDFDANATVAHNTVLVGGRGQVHAADAAGRFVASQVTDQFACFVSEAASVYPDRLDSFRRWVVFVFPDVAVVYDDLKAKSPQHWEWLLHHSGSFAGGKMAHQVENEGVRLAITRLLPSRETPWRATSESRTSSYEDSNALAEVERTVQVRRFGPLFPSPDAEFLWAFHLGQPGDVEWTLDRPSATLLALSGKGKTGRMTLEIDRSGLVCSFRRESPKG